MIDDAKLRAHLRLHLAAGVGPVLYRRLAEAFGGAEAVLGASAGRLMQVDGIGQEKAAAIMAVTDADVDEELAEAARCGATILTPDDATYPAALKTIHDPPAALYVRGRLEAADAIAVGVVGSRRCTHYGLEQSERFAQLLGRAGFTVVSGGARGIDTAAHRGALAAGARTIAVMGCGLSTTYPPENAKLFEQIVAERRGALISELPMRTAVLAGNFPTRNRIISGLSLGVLVVEAARKSGARLTAREAAEQGRQVFAVPGRVDSPMSQGANELIRDGAVLVQDLDDMLEHLGEVGSKMSAPKDEAPAAPTRLDETEQKIVAALANGELGLDELCRQTELASGKAAAALTMLVIKGAVAQRPGKVFAAKHTARK